MITKKTTNYRIFKHKKGNRPVYPGHLSRLVKSIKKNNMLAANPIIVNEEMFVIDGQHRLEAAKILKEPIFYITFNPASIEEIQLLNANQKNWTADDYANSYIALGNRNYQIYREFKEKYRFGHSVILMLLSGQATHKGLTQGFREGKLVVADLNQATEIADEITEASHLLGYGTLGSTKFFETLFKVLEKNDMKLFDFLGKLKISGVKIYNARKTLEYVRQFEDVLNYGRRGARIRLT